MTRQFRNSHEIILHELQRWHPSLLRNVNDDNANEALMDIVSVNYQNGALQITWEYGRLDQHTLSQHSLPYEVAFRSWDQTHGLKDDDVIANVASPHMATLLVEALLKEEVQQSRMQENLARPYDADR